MRFVLVFIFSFWFFCFPVFASYDMFADTVQVPELPLDDSRPYSFIAYYPSADKYLLVQLSEEMYFKSSATVPYNYYMDLREYDFKLYQWFPSLGNSWENGRFADGNTSNSMWYAWNGFGGCPSDYYGVKKILYSNFSVRNEEDNSVMFYKTPRLSGLNWQWTFTGFIQQIYTIIMPVLAYVCIFILSIFCVLKLVGKLHLFWKGR